MTTPTKNESLPELPEYAASLHVQHFRNAPSMRNTDFVESFDFPEGAHRLYTADQMRAYAEAALTREAPTEGVVACHRVTCRCIPGAGHVWRDGDIPDDERAYWEQRGDEFVIERAYKPASTPPAPHRLAQGEDIERALTAAMREADALHERVGGGTRHYVRDCLLPTLAHRGLTITTQPPHHDRGDIEQQTVAALVDRIDWWADKYEAEGGHAVVVQLLRQYAGMVAKIPTAALTEAKQQGPGEAVLDRPARVAGRDFAAGQSTRQVIGRAQAHYEVHHEGCLRHPHTGEPRDYRDVESDPDGTLCVGPGPLPSAGTRQRGNSVLAPMKTVFVIQRPDGTPFQRDDAMGILATDDESQAIRFAYAREDEEARYVRYVATAPQVEAKRQTGGEHG